MKQSLKDLLNDVWKADRHLRFYGLGGLESTHSFAEFGKLVKSFEGGLSKMDAGPGTVVAVMGPTNPNLAALCAAVWGVEATLTVLATPTRLAN